MINKEIIENKLKEAGLSLFVECKERVDSTNTILYKAASEGASEGRLLVAENQTLGKGRRGRSFYSPPGSGVYFSVILRPAGKGFPVHMITVMAASAICLALKESFDIHGGIKWVNDIFYNDKKVCGILAESHLDESQKLDFVILGIGVNLSPPKGGFPEEIKGTAGALFEGAREGAAEILVASVMKHFYSFYNEVRNDCMDVYRSRSMVIGKRISVLDPLGEKSAAALFIDDDGALVVQYETGCKERLTFGEISIRME